MGVTVRVKVGEVSVTVRVKVGVGGCDSEGDSEKDGTNLADVFPLPLQNHFFVLLHITTAAGS